MDILQRKHAFDQLEKWLSEVKDSFIDGYGREHDEEIDRLNDDVANLEEENRSTEERADDLESENDELKSRIKKAIEILGSYNRSDDLNDILQKALDALE